MDASAWVALMDAKDRQHAAACESWRAGKSSRSFFLTSDYVLDEAYTLLRRRRNGLAMAIALHDLVESSRLIEIAEIGEDLRQDAWRIFVGYQDKVISFTDCTSFALMRSRKLFEVFTFDSDFTRAGFVVRPD